MVVIYFCHTNWMPKLVTTDGSDGPVQKLKAAMVLFHICQYVSGKLQCYFEHML